MTMEEAKEVKGFIPENPFPEPKRKRIKAIQADAVQRGLPEPTKEQVREILFKQWKKTHPDIRDFEIHFDFEHEQMHFKSIAVDNSKEEKTI